MRKSSLIVWLLVAMLVVVAAVWYWKVERFVSTPRLSQQQVVGIARQVAIEHKERLEDYKPPEANFYDGTAGTWVVFFDRKSPRDFRKPETLHIFGVAVDDKTGRAEYFDTSHMVK